MVSSVHTFTAAAVPAAGDIASVQAVQWSKSAQAKVYTNQFGEAPEYSIWSFEAQTPPTSTILHNTH